jgi:hypothetical protein
MTKSPSIDLLNFDPATQVAVTSGHTLEEILRFMDDTGVWQVIPGQSPRKSLLEARCAKLRQNPAEVFQNPAQTLLLSEGPLKIRKWKFRSSSEKSRVLDSVKEFISSQQNARAIQNSVLFVADELFTNAVFNAPFGDLDMTLDRSTVVVLDYEKMAEFVAICTEDRLLIGVTDQFGSMDCENLLNHLIAAEKSSAGFQSEKGGAGIGLIQAIHFAEEFFCICEMKKSTFVAFGFPLKESQNRTRLSAKSLHISEFQILNLGPIFVRIEKRGKKNIAVLSGSLCENISFQEIEVGYSDLLEIDLSQINRVDKNGLLSFETWLKSKNPRPTVVSLSQEVQDSCQKNSISF